MKLFEKWRMPWHFAYVNSRNKLVSSLPTIIAHIPTQCQFSMLKQSGCEKNQRMDNFEWHTTFRTETKNFKSSAKTRLLGDSFTPMLHELQ